MASLSRFKLKDWQKDSNRWLIAFVAIILMFLVVCVRHSWRADYNYPIPIKLQGRYLYTFGPLFLITIFAFLDTPFKSINRMKLITYSSAMISAAYAVLFLGIQYLIGPLPIAPASPDGELIKAMGISFIILTLANVILSSLMINRKKITLITSMVFFLFGFFFYGNLKILQNRINSPTQLINSQIYYFVQEYKTLSPEDFDKDQPPLTIYTPNENSSTRINLWKQTLIFEGFNDVAFQKSNIAEVDPAVILQARNSDYVINLRELTETEFLLSDNKKYTHSGKFFEFQVMPIN